MAAARAEGMAVVEMAAVVTAEAMAAEATAEVAQEVVRVVAATVEVVREEVRAEVATVEVVRAEAMVVETAAVAMAVVMAVPRSPRQHSNVPRAAPSNHRNDSPPHMHRSLLRASPE